MKRSRGALMLFILPTDSLFVGSVTADELLSKVEASLKTIIEAIVSRWAELESGWDTAPVNGLPTDATIQEQVEIALIEDYLSDAHGEHTWLNEEDLHDLTILLHGCCEEVFEEIIPIFEDMDLSTYQLQTLRPMKWLGKSLVVDIVV